MFGKLRLRWRGLLKRFKKHEVTQLEKYAERELKMAELFDQDSVYGGMIAPAIMELIRVFSDQGHSGYSAQIVLKLFAKVANWQPIQPLTGTDDEWTEYADGQYQNKRCGRVFKEGKNGVAYDSEGKIFRTSSGGCYTNIDSRVAIKFPYIPKTEYVDVKE